MIRLIIALVFLAGPVLAETVVAARTIPARSIIGPDDVLLRDLAVPNGVTAVTEAVGKEARVALYAGRPILSGDLGPPALVERNQIVLLTYRRNGLVISTEGRVLDRAGPGEIVRVMNLTSRSTVSARIDANGVANVIN